MRLRVLLISLVVLLGLAQPGLAQPGQRAIKAIEMMPNIPQPFEMRDWKEVARKYDALVFDFSQTGQYLPLIKWDNRNVNFKLQSFMIPSYVGSPGGNEALTQISAVLGATLVGIDKSNQNGQNWVLMTKQYFNAKNGLGIVNNNVNSTGGSFWYNVWPGMLFFMLSSQYPETAQIQTELSFTNKTMSMQDIMYANAQRWTEAVADLRNRPDIHRLNLLRYDLLSGQPVYRYENDKYRFANGNQLHEGLVGIAWMNYMAYTMWGEPEFLETVEWCMDFVEDSPYNPLYEVIVPYGAYLAARLNAELGTDYDVKKYIDWTFGPADARPGWGIVHGTWAGKDVNGLMGSITTDYVFAMNTFATVAAFVPVARYDSSFARAIGKYVLNAANNARLFYGKYHDDEHRTRPDWEGDPESVIAYEALRREWNGKTLYAMGDGVKNDWAPTDFGLYGSSHVGLMAACIGATNDEKILQLDLLATDFFHAPAYPSYLYYNPYSESKTVAIDVGSAASRLYDAVSKQFISGPVTGETAFELEADSAAVIVVTPADGEVAIDGKRLLVDGVVVDYQYASVKFSNLQGGDIVHDRYPVALAAVQLTDPPLYTAAYLDDRQVYYTEGLAGQFALDTSGIEDGSLCELRVEVGTASGFKYTDRILVTVDNRILGRAGALDPSSWAAHERYPASINVENTTVMIQKSNANDEWGGVVSPVFELDLGRRPILRLMGVYAPGRYLVRLRWEDGTETALAEPASDARLEIDIAEALSEASQPITPGVHHVQLILGSYSTTRRVSIWDFGSNVELFYQD